VPIADAKEACMNAVTGTHSRPWYREPLVWLVAAIPALTVVAGITTVVIAGRHADPVVVDDFRKEGVAINIDPARDQAATRLGVAADLSDGNGRLAVALSAGRAEAPRRLVVILSHATRAELDRMLTLERGVDGRYAAAMPSLERGHWYVEVTPVDREWRLTGEFRDSAAALSLRPAAARTGS
jgi:hypothetical protein